MLTTLRIKNLALVTDLTQEMQPGFNAISGETGAGKSILIGALNLVLGERADRTLIRSGCDACSVEAVFDVSALASKVQRFLEDNGLEPCDGNLLFLKRTVTASGANRQFVNGSPATLGALARLGEWLVDIHGPHDHQSLLHPSCQLAILDSFGGLEKDRRRFEELLRCREALEAEKKALIVDEKSYAQQLDLLRFQVNEIRSARLCPGEDEALEQEYRRAGNASKILQTCQATFELLSESETSLLSQAGAIGKLIHDLQRLDSSVAPLAELHDQAVQTLQDLQAQLRHYAEKVDLDPASLQEMEDRLNLIHALKRKYGATLADVIQHGEEAFQRLTALEQRDTELARINGEIGRVNADLRAAGCELTARRRKIIPKLCKAVMRQLEDLGFKQSHFAVSLRSISEGLEESCESSGRVASSGFDTVEFEFSPNPGEQARPLRAIASSGEMARVMLALKTVLADQDEVPVLVFDEVDANIGGETASTVGSKMRQIGGKRQVICITHLASVAAEAAAHFAVSKEVEAGRTVSAIRLLKKQDRVHEIARMLGGRGSAALTHARALIDGK